MIGYFKPSSGIDINITANIHGLDGAIRPLGLTVPKNSTFAYARELIAQQSACLSSEISIKLNGFDVDYSDEVDKDDVLEVQVTASPSASYTTYYDNLPSSSYSSSSAPSSSSSIAPALPPTFSMKF